MIGKKDTISKYRTCVVFCFLVAAIAGLGQDFEEMKLRTWTSASGSKVDAEFQNYQNGLVVLKTQKGKFLRISLNGLSDADQEFVKQKAGLADGKEGDLGDAGASDGKAVSKSENRLPYFEGERFTFDTKKNKPVYHETHAVYEGKTYRAVVDEEGFLIIFPNTESDEQFRSNLPVTFNFNQGYVPPEDPRNHRRSVVKYVDPPAPSKNPKKLHFKSEHEDGGKRDIIYEFTPDSITFAGTFFDAKDVEDGSNFGMHWHINASHKFELQTPIPVQKKACAGCEIEIEHRQGKDKYNYVETVDIRFDFTRVIDKGRFEGRTLIWEVVEKDREAHIGSYVGFPVNYGYHIGTSNGPYGPDKDKYTSVGRGKKARKEPAGRFQPAKIKLTIK